VTLQEQNLNFTMAMSQMIHEHHLPQHPDASHPLALLRAPRAATRLRHQAAI